MAAVASRPRRINFVTAFLWLIGGGILLIAAIGAFLTLTKGRYSLENWEGFIVSGIALGSVYALVALGYTLVYGILFMINFAHGEVFMFGTFTALFVARFLNDAGMIASQPWLAFLIVIAVAMLVSMTIAVTLERVAYRPLRGAPRLVPLITAIGASLFLQYTARGFYGSGVNAYPEFPPLQGNTTILGLTIRTDQVIVTVAAVALMLGLYLFVERTRTGRAMRAVSEDKDVAAMMGINVDRVIQITFAIGGLLAGVAGILYVQLFNQVDFFMGFLPGIKAFTAAVLGGIGNIVGAMLGGMTLGLLEAVAPFLLLDGYGIASPNQLKDAIAFTVLVLVLIFRPSGFLGRKENV
ncbi:MAG TPA: branched-chain amino acid ABC transporter permease [candidate division Zixibacteria bacterium]|nr:branched-chain amino acid ABC transporter permease [candidate division Zixibacteria bacterium]